MQKSSKTGFPEEKSGWKTSYTEGSFFSQTSLMIFTFVVNNW
jgi:hypothetical protein